MGTTTIYTRMNDLGMRFRYMTKKDLKELDNLSAWKKSNYMGWSSPFELHNGNIDFLVWWKGRLMRLKEASQELNRKYYNKYKGKTMNKYEWTILKRLIFAEVEYFDKKFKKEISRKKLNGKNLRTKNTFT